MSGRKAKLAAVSGRSIVFVAGAAVLFAVLAVVASMNSGGATSAAVSPPMAAAPGVALRGAVLGAGSQQVGDLTVWLSALDRQPVRGQNMIEALVVDASGKPVNDCRVAFDLDMTNMSHGKNVVQAQSVGDGRYDGSVFFMMPGPWRIIATVERGGKAVGSARFDFNVNLR